MGINASRGSSEVDSFTDDVAFLDLVVSPSLLPLGFIGRLRAAPEVSALLEHVHRERHELIHDLLGSQIAHFHYVLGTWWQSGVA